MVMEADQGGSSGLSALLGRFFSRRSSRRREQESARQWFLLFGRQAINPCQPPEFNALTPFYPPADRFWADPFLWSEKGRWHVFFEEYPYQVARGHISAMEIDPERLEAGPVQRVLEAPHHLSYPYLFSLEGELYMVPEQKAARRVDLFRCTQYPNRFEWVRTLFRGVRMVDVTIFPHEGRWWLFASEKRAGFRYDESLFAYSTDHPVTGTWVPHAGNPLIRDYESARPGGRVFRHSDGSLLRPSQVCRPHYGAGLNLNRIETLSMATFRESRLWRCSGEAAGGWRGMHHLDVREDYLVMDAEREHPHACCPKGQVGQ